MSARALLHRLARDDRGTSMIELAAGIVVFLLIFFALMDFGRMTYNWVTAEKAVQMAARMATVLPPVSCAGQPVVPNENLIVSGSTAAYGTPCSPGTNICFVQPATVCNGSKTPNSTGKIIFDEVAGLLPPGATEANLRYTYSFDPTINFLGGPYVPLVTVELTGLRFEFVSPLAGLAMAAGAATDTRTDGLIPFPPMSVSLPGEDLNLGTNG